MELKKKLLEVSKAIDYLQKDKTNSAQGYKYLSEAKIKRTFKKLFEKHGVLFNCSTVSVREYEISTTSKGTKQFCTIANGTYKFMDTDSDVEISGTWFGSGTDTGDKGLYKAITGGIKYVLSPNFLIPTGDDPEKDDDDDDKNGKGKPPTPPIGKLTVDPDAQLKRDLVKQFKGDTGAAKKEYENIVALRNNPSGEELDDEMDKYFKEKFDIKESA